MNYNELGIPITTNSHSIFGILTSPLDDVTISKKKPLVILLPAVSGTRIGPQRIFVEIARDIARLGFSSYRADMASAGDAIEHFQLKNNSVQNPLISWYKGYLNVITSFFKKAEYNYDDYMLLSISLGCEPILKYAVDNSLNSVVFLSPTYLNYVDKKKINNKNLKAYFYKLFNKNTWIKLYKLKLNWKNIMRNLIPYNMLKIKFKSKEKVVFHENIVKPNVFGVFGELDKEFEDSTKYWNKLLGENILNDFKYEIVKGSDHNFFGYQFKMELRFILRKWFASL